MKALFELFRRFDARRIFGFIRRLGGMSRPKVKCCVLPAPFRWKATGTGMSMQTAVQISIHALRVEGDHLPLSFLHTVLYFYPRPPGGGRYTAYLSPVVVSNFYPRPPGGGRPLRRQLIIDYWPISIHALRVEGDPS